MPPGIREHLCADEHKDKGEADAEIAEITEQIRKKEIERAQAKNGEDIGSKNDKRIAGNSENGGNGIYCKGDVGNFDDEKDEEQRSGERLAILTQEKAFAVKFLGDAKMSAGEAEDGIAFKVHGLVAFPEHVNSGVNKEGTEGGKKPVEARDQGGAGGDHDTAHEESANNAPGEDAVLNALVNVKSAENDEKDEKIVDAESFFNDIAGKVFQTALCAEPVPDKKSEAESKGNPDGAKEGRFADTDLVSFTMDDTQVKGERDQNK